MKKLIASVCLAVLGLNAQAAWPTGEPAAVIAQKIDLQIYKPDKTWCNTNPATVWPGTAFVLRVIHIVWTEPTPSFPNGMLHSCKAYIYD